jgi:hypothetical protein
MLLHWRGCVTAAWAGMSPQGDATVAGGKARKCIENTKNVEIFCYRG